MCTRQPYSRRQADQQRDGGILRAARARGQPRRVRPRIARPAAAVPRAVPRAPAARRPLAPVPAWPARRSALGDVFELRHAGRREEAFEAPAARFQQRRELRARCRARRRPRSRHPPSTGSAPPAIFACKASTDVVAGMAFSGISISVVMPPAAAACVAVAKPSHSVRPGFVDVDVRVHQAGHDDQIAVVDGGEAERLARSVRSCRRGCGWPRAGCHPAGPRGGW